MYALFISIDNLNQRINQEMDIADDNSPQAINEIYKIWKKNVPFLYNVLQSYQLPSCSQTVEWLPQKYILDAWQINHLIVGSNSSIKNNISVIQIKLPTDQALVDHSAYKQLTSIPDKTVKNQNTVGTLGQQLLHVTKIFPQFGQIMKIRAFKGTNKKSELLGVSIGGAAPMFYVCDLAQDQNVVDQNKIVLDGHENQGFCIDWHPEQQNSLITGAFDQKLCLWDLSENQSVLQPKSVMQHNSPLEDAKWCKKDTNILGTSCQDNSINLWDLRETGEKPSMSKRAHKGEVYSIDFNNFTQYLLLSGGADSQIVLWDIRNLNKSLHEYIGHNDLISSVKWSTANPYTFTSSSFDRRVVVWDIRCEQNEHDMVEQQQSKEIVFIHGGHRSRVTDFCWNEQNKICASVQQNNMVQVWQMNEKLQI